MFRAHLPHLPHLGTHSSVPAPRAGLACALLFVAAEFGLGGCAAVAAPPANSASDCASVASQREQLALPRFVAVRVSGAEVSVAGEQLAGEKLAERLKREGRNALNHGAALIIPQEMSPDEAGNWVALLLTAGFAHVVVNYESALRDAAPNDTAPNVALNNPSSNSPSQNSPSQNNPSSNSPSQNSPSPNQAATKAGALPTERPRVSILPSEPAMVPAAPAAPVTATSAANLPSETRGTTAASAPTVSAADASLQKPTAPAELPRVEVKPMGLHIGGGPNTEEEIARFTGPIERHFSEFRGCYAYAKGTRKAASFGVDLLIPAKGGRPTVRDFRTVLTGKDFLACMLDVFGSVEFTKTGKLTVISYSVLFKPLP